MAMTKKEARAIVACRNKIIAALDACYLKLSIEQSQYADNYWMAHIRQSLDGHSYGSAPTGEAEELLED